MGPMGPGGSLPPTIGGPFSSLNLMAAASRKPFEGPGSPLMSTKLPSSFLPGAPPPDHPGSPALSLGPLIPGRPREPHPLLAHLRPPFLPPGLYPALATLGVSAASPYPASMASFHSVLASLSAYRPGLGGGPTPDLPPDYAALLKAASAAPASPPHMSPPTAEEAKTRLDSVHELRQKAREYEMKLEQETKKINTET